MWPACYARQPQDDRYLFVLELEGDRDHMIVGTIVAEPNGHRVQRRQFSHRR